MAESRIITSFQLNNGDVIRKTEDSDGQIRYRRGSVKSKKGGQFISNGQGRELEKLAAGDSNYVTNKDKKNPQTRFIVKPQRNNEREDMIQKAFPRWGQVTGLNPNKIPANSPQMINSIKAWMRNETVRSQVNDNPLLNTTEERQKAREARARQIVGDLQGVKSEREAIEVLKSYGIY